MNPLSLFDHIDPIAKLTFLYLLFFFAAAGLAIIIYEKAKKKIDNNLRLRYFSWYLIAPAVIVPCYFGDIPFSILVCVMALTCQHEFFSAVKVWELKSYKWTGRVAGFLLVATAFLASSPVPAYLSKPIKLLTPEGIPIELSQAPLTHLGGFPLIINNVNIFYVLPIFIIMLVLAIPVFKGTYEGMLMKECFTIFGILYFGWFLGHLVFLRNMPNGFGYVIFLTMAVVINDVLAYTAGRLWGKTPLCPQISPKKTREGLAGGMIGSLLAAFIFKYAIPDINIGILLGASVIIGIAAPLGDLIISVIKRDVAIKDSGNLIPGHGGLLDRCDSLIFATPAFFYYLQFVQNWKF